jgi:hypothetical protein
MLSKRLQGRFRVRKRSIRFRGVVTIEGPGEFLYCSFQVLPLTHMLDIGLAVAASETNTVDSSQPGSWLECELLDKHDLAIGAHLYPTDARLGKLRLPVAFNFRREGSNIKEKWLDCAIKPSIDEIYKIMVYIRAVEGFGMKIQYVEMTLVHLESFLTDS